MENVDPIHAIWGGVVTAFSFLGKKILRDYDEKFKRMQEGEAKILKSLEDLNELIHELNVQIARIEVKLESKSEKLLRRSPNV